MIVKVIVTPLAHQHAVLPLHWEEVFSLQGVQGLAMDHWPAVFN